MATTNLSQLILPHLTVQALRVRRISLEKPPTTNRGVEKETISQKCDWIAFTVPFYKDLTWPSFVTQNWKIIPPVKHYTDGQENLNGIRVYWSKTRPQMGKHVIISGSVLSSFGEESTQLLQHAVNEGYKITRIDLCVDIMHSNFNPKNATYHIEKGQVKTHARKAPRWDDPMDVGYTQYIGKKSSECFVRIYDKAAEMGVNFRWIRAEVVYSGDRATPASKTYLQCGDCRSMVQNFVDFPKWRKWQYIMHSETVKVRAPAKQSNTRYWLLNQVTKSLAKEMTLEDDHDFYLQFIQRVREEYLNLNKEKSEVDF